MGAAAVLTAALTACTLHARTGVIGDDIDGAGVARTIDTRIAPLLQSVPDLTVGRATCPDHLDLSNGKTVYCTLPAGEAMLRIRVTSGTEYGKYFVKQADSLFDMRRLERAERVDLADQYGVNADVRCGAPRFRAAATGTTLSCALSGKNVPADRVEWQVLNDMGRVKVLRPYRPSPAMHALLPYLRAHDNGGRTIVPGPMLARVLYAMTKSQVALNPEVGWRLGPASCPAQVDLSGTRRGVCRQVIFGKALRYNAWIDGPHGFHLAAVDFAFPTKRVSTEAADYYRHQLETAGRPELTAVDCGPDRVAVVDAKHGILCRLTYGATTRPLTVYPNAGKGLRFYLPPLPSPAP